MRGSVPPTPCPHRGRATIRSFHLSARLRPPSGPMSLRNTQPAAVRFRTRLTLSTGVRMNAGYTVGQTPLQGTAVLGNALPQAQGLYNPEYEHDACGVAFVATLTGVPSHAIVEQGLEALA